MSCSTNTKPDIAIVIPAFNAERTIGLTLASISKACETLANSNRLYGVILSDDGSTDRTVETAKQAWTNVIPLIIRVGRENRGEAAAMNSACAAIPSGVSWMAILHADDVCSEEWLKKLAMGIDNADAEVASVCCSWNTVNDKGVAHQGDNRGFEHYTITMGNSDSVHSTLVTGSWWHISGAAVRISAYVQMGGRDPNMPQCGDWALLLRWLASGWDILYVPEALVDYRIHQSSVSSASFRNHRDIMEQMAVMEEFSMAYKSVFELSKEYFRRVAWLTRRFGLSIIRLDHRRARQSVIVCTALVRSFALALSKYKGISRISSRHQRYPLD